MNSLAERSENVCVEGDTRPERGSKVIPIVRSRAYYPFERIVRDLEEGFEREGDLVQLTGFFVRVYCLRDPEQIKAVFDDPKVGIAKVPQVIPRLRWLMPFSVVVKRAHTSAEAQQWDYARKQVRAAFDAEFMRGYGAWTTRLVAKMLDARWERYAETGEQFDIYQEFQRLLTQLGFCMFFSTELAEPEIERISRRSHFIEQEFACRFAPFFPTPNNLRFRRYVRELKRDMLQLVVARREKPTHTPDLLSVLMGLKEQNGQPYADEVVVDQMIELFSSVRLVNPPLGLGLRLIASQATVQDRLHDEVTQVCGSNAPEREHLQDLRYTRMVNAETFRFYPSALSLPRWCQDGMEIDGYQIPPRSVVIPTIFHTHRNPQIFPDPYCFDPDRWDPDAPQKIHPYARLGFGQGKRTCLGVDLANMITRLSIAAVAQRYRLVPSKPFDTKRDVTISVHPREPVIMSIRRFEDPGSPSNSLF